MAPPLLQLTDAQIGFGGAPLLDGAGLSVSAGERVALVGRNGSGKSTLLKIAAGLLTPHHAKCFLQPGATIRYLPQEPDFGSASNVLDYVEAGLAPGDDPYRARVLLEGFGLTGEELPGAISGGEARRAALARVLAPDPDILLLDEPTNHLDLWAIHWLESVLAQRRGALVMISHDRRFLQTLGRVTVWLDRGKTRRVEMGFREFENWRDEVLAEEERDAHKQERKIKAEEHWLRYGVTARRKRNVRRLENLQNLRRDHRDRRKATGMASLVAAQADSSGSLVIEAKAVAKSFGARKIVENFSLNLQRGNRIGIIGRNGIGKTTLVRLLTGDLAPDLGTVKLGANLQMARLEQGRDSLDPEVTVSDALTGGHGDQVTVAGKTRHVVGYMKDFLFAPEQAATPLRLLSGGERARLMLARVLARPSNLLVLDEPTNDLDLETLDVLEEAIGDYTGTVILISHDRDFLDRVVGSVIAPEGNGTWIEYAGGYSDMLLQRGADPTPPHGAPAQRLASQSKPRVAAKSSPERRLNFKEKHALATLPNVIATLEAKRDALNRSLEDPEFFARDRRAFDAASKSLAEIQAELSASEERWLELELLRSEIDGT